MTKIKLHFDSIKQSVTYSIEDEYDELKKITVDDIKKYNKLVENLTKSFSSQITSHVKNEQNPPLNVDVSNPVPTLTVPDELVPIIEKLDERIKFPMLWYFSSVPIMTVSDFLNLCSSEGFTLNSYWLPSAGGHFSGKLVNSDKMFHRVGRQGKEKTWELTKIGKLKLSNKINELKK